MKKKLAVVAASVMTMGMLVGCEESVIKYKGEYAPVSEVEERIADEMEVENPDLDLEVSIFEEQD